MTVDRVAPEDSTPPPSSPHSGLGPQADRPAEQWQPSRRRHFVRDAAGPMRHAVTVNDGGKVLVELLRQVGQCLLPYPDPLRRRRLRRHAHALVSWTSWPGDTATPVEVAELALVRLLWLQRETHRAARSKQKEAAALLTRTATETCIAGMWAVYGGDTTARLRNQYAKALGGMAKYLAGSVVPSEFVQRLVGSVGEPIGPLSAPSMVEVIIGNDGPIIARNLYERYYVPASALYAHGGVAAMLRHVDSHGAQTEAPETGWLLRSAVHVADGCVAELAMVIAGATGRPVEPFERYAKVHLSRAMPPVASIGGGGLLRSLNLKSLPRALRGIRTLRRYLNSDTRRTDSSETAESVIAAAMKDAISLSKGDTALQSQILTEELIRQLSEQAASAEQVPAAGGAPVDERTEGQR